MAKISDLHLSDWNNLVALFHSESDRGAAVLVGGFVENYLGKYLKSYIVDEKVGRDIFEALGPLSSFSQRIALARAFGFIGTLEYRDLTSVRKIRNQFAHHPLEMSFASPEIAKLCLTLSCMKVAEESEAGSKFKEEKKTNRLAYLISCAQLCGMLEKRLENRSEKGKGRKTIPPLTR